MKHHSRVLCRPHLINSSILALSLAKEHLFVAEGEFLFRLLAGCVHRCHHDRLFSDADGDDDVH